MHDANEAYHHKEPDLFPETLPNTSLAWQSMGLVIVGLLLCVIIGFAFNKYFLLDRGMRMLSVPLIGFLYIYRPHADLSAIRPPSATMLGWSVAGFFFALVASADWAVLGMCIGVLSGIFLRLNPRLLLQQMNKNKRIYRILLAGILCAPVLALLRNFIWMPLAKLTAYPMVLLLQSFYTDILIATRHNLQIGQGIYAATSEAFKTFGMRFGPRQMNFVMVTTDSNTFMKITANMNIGNGLFLYVVMIAVMALYQPSLFRKISPWKIYGFGFVFIWAANVLWLSMLYLLLPAANNVSPDAVGAAVGQLMSITSSSSFIGWVGYLMLDAVPVILLWYYSRRLRTK